MSTTSHPNPPASAISFNTDDYRQLELFAETASPGRPATVCCTRGQGPEGQAATRVALPAHAGLHRVTFTLTPGSTATLSWRNARIACAYLCGNDSILDTGIRLLPLRQDGMTKASARNFLPRLHFASHLGKAERPAALARFQGRWHLFYLLNLSHPGKPPTAWAHAVSLDLVHWKDLPIFRASSDGPQKGENSRVAEVSGGCAIPVDVDGHPCEGDSAAGLRVYFAQSVKIHYEIPSHIQTIVRLESLLCTDGVHARDEHTVGNIQTGEGSVSGRQKLVDPSLDLSHKKGALLVSGTELPASQLPPAQEAGRSDIPDQVRADGRHGWFARGPHRTPGEDTPSPSQSSARPAILAAMNKDPALANAAWSKASPVLMENGIGMASSLAHASLFLLDSKTVALGSLQNYRDGVGGRFQPERCYIGRLQDVQAENGAESPRLLVDSARWLDFGPSLSAAQTCENQGRRLLVGRIGNPDLPPEGNAGTTDQAVSGALTLPRVLHIRDGQLFQHPATEVYVHALGDILTQTTAPNLSDSPLEEDVRLDIPSNAYYADLRLTDPARHDRFRLLLAQWKRQEENRSLAFSNTNEDGFARFVTSGILQLASIDPVSTITSVRRVEVFYDRGICEVFLNDGQAVGTIAVPDPRSQAGIFEAVLPRGAQLTLRLLNKR